MAKKKPRIDQSNNSREKAMYISPSIDTHKFVKSFTLTGMAENQAEAIVSAIVQSRDHDLSNLATKEQVLLLKEDIDSLKEEMKLYATKEQVADLKEEMRLYATKDQLETVKTQLEAKIENSISRLESSLLKWFIATAIAMTGIIIAAINFIR